MVGPRRCRARAPRLAVAVLALAACTPAGDSSPPAPTTAPSAATHATTTAAPDPDVPALHPSVDDWPAGVVEVVADDGRVHTVAVRIAGTPDRRAHGLMEVPEVPPGVGMWFAYDEERTGGFWMKDTLVPLDIAYVGADGQVVSIARAEPCAADPCPTYAPAGPYQHVLEVAAGEFERMGAGVGAPVRLVDR